MHPLMRRTAIALNLLIVMLLLASCGASRREQVLRVTLASVNAAADGFVAYDETRQAQIIAEAATFGDGQAKLAAYRERRSKMIERFKLVYKAIAVAALLDDERSLASMLQAAAILQDEIKSFLGGKTP